MPKRCFTFLLNSKPPGLWYTNVQTSYSGRIANRTGVESGKSENPAGFLGASITPRLTVQILLLCILLHSQLPAQSCQFSGFRFPPAVKLD